MKLQILTAALIVLLAAGCKREYDAQPTYAKPALAATWAKPEQYYSPGPQIYQEATGTWRNFSSFSVTTEGEPDKLGFTNPYVPGRGTNLLYMNNLYGTNPGYTNDSGYYNFTAIKLFQFIPKSPDSIETGTVIVLPQKITIYTKAKEKLHIGVGPSDQPGTYDTRSGVFEIEVKFDDTEIGGPSEIKRRYRFNAN
ncbi:MAG: hypothetical protein ACO1NW_03335 [Chitinophagaceae bacterium]